MLRAGVACGLLLGLAACPGPGPGVDAGLAGDAGSEARPDAGGDAGAGVGLDGGGDAGADGGGEPADGGGADAGEDGGADAGADAGVDAGVDGGVTDLCAAGERRCLSHDRRRACVASPQGLRWLDESCAPGSGCVQGTCVAGACSDECTLGETDGGATCALVELASGAPLAPDAGGSLHDRARDYARWLRRDGLAAGSVGNPRYADPPTYSQISSMGGIGDSAIWTGTYLAAEALRLQATGAPDARANVISLVNTVHVLLSVSGSPGYLARYAKRSSVIQPFVNEDHDCTAQRVHCGVSWQGDQWDYIGHVSRDQYQGVVLGYALAYDALGPEDAATRDVVRADMVTLVKELMRERQVPVRLTFNGLPLLPTTVSARFMVVNPAEMSNGALDLTIDTSGAGEMYGFQEFYPNLGDLVREFPGLSWVTSIPRASSAVMLASFFRVALRMTEGDPRFAADHAAILAYYTSHSGPGGNITDWLTVANQWTPGTGCSQSYYANNILFEPLYNLSRLEDDPTRRAEIQGQLFSTRIWPTFATTKNPFFSFIYAGTVSGASASVVSSAVAQLSQFPPPPRVHVPIDLRSDPRYLPHEPGCADQVSHSTAVDVADRAVSDFIWQRDPWKLFDWGDVAQTYPGVDYLVAYWMGRKHGFIADDAAGRCLVWR